MDSSQRLFSSNPSPPTITGENGLYIQEDLLGNGSFGGVYRARRVHDNLMVAMKISNRFPGMTTFVGQSFANELDALRRLRHSHITSYIDHVTTPNLYIMMELAPYGDFENMMKLRQLTVTDVGVVTCQCLSALDFIHSNGFIHRDVRPANILVQSRTPLIVKISDFGTAKLLDQVESATTYTGTCRYMAPEVKRLEQWKTRPGPRTRMLAAMAYDNKADIWSMGAVLMAICYPQGVDMQNEAQVLDLLRQVSVPEDAQTLIVKMTRSDARTRPSAREALDESWCKRYIDEAFEISRGNKGPGHTDGHELSSFFDMSESLLDWCFALASTVWDVIVYGLFFLAV